MEEAIGNETLLAGRTRNQCPVAGGAGLPRRLAVAQDEPLLGIVESRIEPPSRGEPGAHVTVGANCPELWQSLQLVSRLYAAAGWRERKPAG